MAASMEKAEHHAQSSDRGAVLLLALVFMLMLALVAATVMQTAMLQLHMAGNDQFMEEALQQAQAIAAELSRHPENFYLEGGVGDTNCRVGIQTSDCDRSLLPQSTLALTATGVTHDYRITRLDPLLRRGFPFRESEDRASSNDSFDAASFEISVDVDGSDKRLGSAHVVQGIAVRIPASR